MCFFDTYRYRTLRQHLLCVRVLIWVLERFVIWKKVVLAVSPVEIVISASSD